MNEWFISVIYLCSGVATWVSLLEMLISHSYVRGQPADIYIFHIKSSISIISR